MKALAAFSSSLLLLGIVALSQTASADTAEATCEVRKDGESWNLTPGDAANQYRDQKGVRDSVAGGYVTSHYQGHGKCVIVNLDTDNKVTSIDEGPGC